MYGMPTSITESANSWTTRHVGRLETGPRCDHRTARRHLDQCERPWDVALLAQDDLGCVGGRSKGCRSRALAAPSRMSCGDRREMRLTARGTVPTQRSGGRQREAYPRRRGSRPCRREHQTMRLGAAGGGGGRPPDSLSQRTGWPAMSCGGAPLERSSADDEIMRSRLDACHCESTKAQGQGGGRATTSNRATRRRGHGDRRCDGFSLAKRGEEQPGQTDAFDELAVAPGARPPGRPGGSLPDSTRPTGATSTGNHAHTTPPGRVARGF